MKIRSITAFVPLSWPLDPGSIASIARFLTDARLKFIDAGFEVQTIRLATPPFLDVIGDPKAEIMLDFAHRLEEMAIRHHIDYVSIGPVVATTPLSLLMPIGTLPRVIAETERIFSAVLFADQRSGVNLAAALDFAEAVHETAQITPNGFGNLRLAALANVPAGVPYFPAAYYHGGPACFAIATEAADLALTALSHARSLPEAQQRLVSAINSTAAHLMSTADTLVDDHQVGFNGIDFSLAPHPTPEGSIGAAIEKLGLDSFGGSGTLLAVAFLTHCIRQVNLPHYGFSGVMLPVMEDSVLAKRAEEGSFSVHDLLLYAAVCGTGLDTVPIPGTTSPVEMAAIFADMAALAVTLNKPLTARLLPIPGMTVGQKIEFDFEYFAPSRILPVKNLGAENLFRQSSFLKLKPQGH